MALTKVDPTVVDDQIIGRKNIIINGDMKVHQRGTSATTLSTTSEIFRADRFRVEQGTVTGNNGTTEVSTDVPSGQGFTKSLKVTGGSSVSYGTNGFTAINYRGEGQDFSQVLHGTSSAKTVTISFWVKSSVTGTYSLNHTKYDGSTERFNVSEYTISQANTWEYKKVNVVGDTSVAASDWIRLYWQLGGDSGHKTATAGTWINGDATKRATSNQPDMITTNGATFFLTGVQFEVGDTATPFEFINLGEQTEQCRRYFQYHEFPDSAAVMNGCMWLSTSMYGAYHFYPKMRAEPTTTISAGATFDVLSPSGQTGTSPTSAIAQNHSNQSVEIYLLNNSGLGTQGDGVWVRSDTYSGAVATFTFDAEL